MHEYKDWSPFNHGDDLVVDEIWVIRFCILSFFFRFLKNTPTQKNTHYTEQRKKSWEDMVTRDLYTSELVIEICRRFCFVLYIMYKWKLFLLRTGFFLSTGGWIYNMQKKNHRWNNDMYGYE